MYETQYRNAPTPVIPPGSPTFTESQLVLYLIVGIMVSALIVAAIVKIKETIYKSLDK